MSRWGSAFRIIGSALLSPFVGWGLFLSTVLAEDGRRRRDRANRAARNAYNESLVDRVQMLDVSADPARRLAMGRVRVGGQMLRQPWSTGANREKLTMVLEFAGHEIDAFEGWYADDLPLTLDGSGWVQTAPYFKSRTESGLVSGALNGSGGATVTLPQTPLSPPAGSIAATWAEGSGEGQIAGSLTYSVAGNVVTLSGGPAGALYNVSYQYSTGTSLLRIRSWRGTPTQSVGGEIAAEYPGDMRATDHYRGVALAVVDIFFDSDVFTSGPPQISALLRGARVFDPRTSTTAWSQNPALLKRWYALHANGLAMPADELRDADVIADANVADISTAFTVRKPDNSTEVVTLPRYRASLVAATDADPREVWGELMEADAGKWGWQGGALRMRCGALRSSSGTVGPDWIFRVAGEGARQGEALVRITNAMPRERKVNIVSGKCVDPAQRYQVLPFPSVRDSVLVARDGSFPLEVELGAVDHIAHAQHLASIMIREAQAPLRMEMQTGLRGYRCELFDVFLHDHPRYGMNQKPMEVIGWRWSPSEGVSLRWAEISAALFTPQAELRGRDPSPDSNLPLPWDVPRVTGLDATSNTTAVADGSIITRLVVTWDAVAALTVAASGEIEVQYHDLTQPLPAGDWASWSERGDATKAVIPGVRSNTPYAVRARAIRGVPYVRGDWSVQDVVVTGSRRQSLIYRQASEPTGATVLDGDEWYDTDNGNRHHVRAAGAWVAVEVGSGGLAPNAASVVTFDENDFAGAGATGGSYTVRRSLVVTPSVDCTIEFTANATAQGVHPDSAQNLEWWAVRTGSSDLALGYANFGGTTTTGTAQATASFAATAGVAITFELRTRAGSGVSVKLWQSQMRVTEVRR
jgi:hypothetical protein